MQPEQRERRLDRIKELEERLEEAEETLRALRCGEVDAIVVSTPGGECVYTLKSAEEPYRLLVQQMGEGALTVTQDGLILFANEQFASMTGTPLGGVIGTRLEELIAPEDVGAVSAMYAGRDLRKITAGLKTQDGRTIPVQLSASSVMCDSVNCTCIVAMDLSEQKHNEELREREFRTQRRLSEMEAIYKYAPIGLCVLDTDCRFVRVNDQFAEASGWPAEAHIGRSPGDLNADFDELARGLLGRVLAEGKPLLDLELSGITAAQPGVVRTWRTHWVPLRGEDGRINGVSIVAEEITEKKKTEERLWHMQKLESIGLLAGGIAHDFNNLLTGVLGNASLAAEMAPQGTSLAQCLNDIIKASERAAHLTRQMLAYSGKGKFVLQRIDISDLVRDTIRFLHSSVPNRVALYLELQRDLPAVEADASQMQQVVMNLVLNAAEAIGDGAGSITVRTGVCTVDRRYIRDHLDAAAIEPGTYVTLEVRDTGCGMEESTKARIFDPFFTTKFTGRGLGLAAVDGIVRGHQAAIKVSSAPGKGSTFLVLFPAVAGEPEALDARLPATADWSGAGTILVVDDEDTVLRTAKVSLERHGYTILQAESGPQAIEILRREKDRITAVILDLSMPGMSGQETLPELRKIRRDLNVIVSSGYSEGEAMRLFSGQAVSGFIQKPYTAAGLAEKLRAMTRGA